MGPGTSMRVTLVHRVLVRSTSCVDFQSQFAFAVETINVTNFIKILGFLLIWLDNGVVGVWDSFDLGDSHLDSFARET